MELHFLRSLQRRYAQSGYSVYSKYFSELPAAPTHWTGGLADMIVEKGQKRIAIFRVGVGQLRDPNAPVRWRQALENPGTRLKLFAAERRQLKPLKRLLQDHGIAARAVVVNRCQRRRRFWHPRRIGLKAAAFLVLLAAVIAIWLLGLWVFEREVPLYYEPRDLERQAEEWKDSSPGS